MPQNTPDIRIVIAQRGWIFVGEYNKTGEIVSISKGHVVRRWGTTKGLGELATEGKKRNTVLDPTPTIEMHELTVVATIRCDADAWKDEIK